MNKVYINRTYQISIQCFRDIGDLCNTDTILIWYTNTGWYYQMTWLHLDHNTQQEDTTIQHLDSHLSIILFSSSCVTLKDRIDYSTLPLNVIYFSQRITGSADVTVSWVQIRNPKFAPPCVCMNENFIDASMWAGYALLFSKAATMYELEPLSFHMAWLNSHLFALV